MACDYLGVPLDRNFRVSAATAVIKTGTRHIEKEEEFCSSKLPVVVITLLNLCNFLLLVISGLVYTDRLVAVVAYKHTKSIHD